MDFFQDRKNSNLLHIFVVNHRNREGDDFQSLYSVIETFDYTIGSDDIVHTSTIEDKLIWTPNDVAAISETDFYVSNDHKFRHGLMREFETFLRLPLSNVVLYESKTKSARIVVDGITGANGNAISKDKKYYFQSSILRGKILKYRINEDTGDLTYLESVAVPFLPDNLFVTENGNIMVRPD
jgi:arylesterase/paraoxonase